MSNVYPWAELTQHAKRDHGNEKAKCPVCIDQHRDKKRKDLSIQHGSGVAKCHSGSCGALAFQEERPIPSSNNEKNWKTPEETGTSLNKVWIEWLEKRKITPEVAIELGWTLLKGNLCYNFYERGEIVNQKSRSLDKKFFQFAGGKQIFYNINAAVGETELWIVEGEMDVAALYEIGIKNVVSLPSASVGDSAWENSWPYLKHIKKFIIATDMDDAGKKVRKEVARRLSGFSRQYVTFHGKDANDDLITGHLQESVGSLRHFRVDNVHTVNDIRERAFEVFQRGKPNTITPKCDSFGDFREKISFLPGQLTVVTGAPGSGKSEFIDWLVLNICRDHDMRAMWFSPEHGEPSEYIGKFVPKVTGGAYFENMSVPKLGLPEWMEAIEYLNKLILFRDMGDGATTWKQLIQTFKESVPVYGVKIFVVDAFNKVTHDNRSVSHLQQISEAITELSNFAKVSKSLVFLVAHPRKPSSTQNPAPPTMYEISGSADFYNMADNGLILWREDDQTYVKAEKLKYQQYQGQTNQTIAFNFNTATHRYTVRSNDNFKNWTKDTSQGRSSNTGNPRTQQEDVVPF